MKEYESAEAVAQSPCVYSSSNGKGDGQGQTGVLEGQGYMNRRDKDW